MKLNSELENMLKTASLPSILQVIQEREDTIGVKIWSIDDIIEKAKEKNISLTREDAQAVARYIDLSDCTDAEWNLIDWGIEKAIHNYDIQVEDIELD